jgi:hypothetical protein
MGYDLTCAGKLRASIDIWFTSYSVCLYAHFEGFIFYNVPYWLNAAQQVSDIIITRQTTDDITIIIVCILKRRTKFTDCNQLLLSDACYIRRYVDVNKHR